MAGIYIHIPFCKKKCIYCDFYSCTSLDFYKFFFEALDKEIFLRKDYIVNEKIDTIYFGGGTPSLIPVKYLHQVLDTLYKTFSISPSVEITIECNPDDITKEKLMDYQGLSFNRISLGIQSFNDDILDFLNRRHNAEKAKMSLKWASDLFDNISIDLLYGIPDTDINYWKDTLNIAFDYSFQHLSAYILTAESDTPYFVKYISNDKIHQLHDDTIYKQYLFLLNFIVEKQFEQYEVSNFSLTHYQSQHNFSYWNNVAYFGFGPSAHSFNLQSRQWNISDIKKYCNSININNIILSEKENLSLQDKYNEYIMTNFRLKRGIFTDVIAEKFGKNYLEYFISKISDFSSKFIRFDDSNFILTNRGMFLSNSIIEHVLFI